MHPKFSPLNITTDKFLMILHNFKSISVKTYKLFKRIHYILIILFSTVEYFTPFLNFPQLLIIMLNIFVHNEVSLKIFCINFYSLGRKEKKKEKKKEKVIKENKTPKKIEEKYNRGGLGCK